MFKILVLQHLHSFLDDSIYSQIRDRFNFMRFLGLQLENQVQDSKKMRMFRERLKGLDLVEVLFARFLPF